MVKTQGRGRPKKTLTTKSWRPVKIKTDKTSTNTKSESKKTFSKKKLSSTKNKKYTAVNWLLFIAIIVLLVLIYNQNNKLNENLNNGGFDNVVANQTGWENNNMNINNNDALFPIIGQENEEYTNHTEQIDDVDNTENIDNIEENNLDMENTENIEIQSINTNDPLAKIVNDFYENLNQKEYWDLYNTFDAYFKKTGVATTYYTQNWLNNFLDSLANNKIYITEIVFVENPKETTAKYLTTLKYKLDNNDNLFEENWEIIITNIYSNPKIGSMVCKTDGCSKFPFFNPGLYKN